MRQLPYDTLTPSEDLGETRENAIPCLRCRRRRTWHRLGVCRLCVSRIGRRTVVAA